MTYTILSAAFANAEHTAAVLQTQEAGAVLASEADTPDLWAAMQAAVTPTAYSVPFNQAAALARLRDVRKPILDALTGMLSRAIATGDTALAGALVTASEGLLSLPQYGPLLAAQSDEVFDDIALARYRDLATALPASARSAFRDALL